MYWPIWKKTKLEGVRPGYRAEITPLGSNKVLKGTVDSVAAGVTNASSTRDDKGHIIDSNLEWVRLAQRVPVRIRLDNQQENIWPAGTTATDGGHWQQRSRRKPGFVLP